MTYQGAWTGRPDAPALQPRDWAARPRYAPEDFVTLMWRERWLMIAVFLVIFVIGGGAAFLLKTTYPAHSSILVRLGQEYVYEPAVGDAGRGAIPNTDQLVQSEVEILSSDELKQRVIKDIGYGRMFPAKAEAFRAASAGEKSKMLGQGVAAMTAGLKIDTAPDTSVIRLTYEDTDPQRAAQVLNALLDEYLIFRRTVLLDGTNPFVDEQKRAFETKLNGVDAAYQAFLAENGIGDFDSEKTSLNALQASLTDENYRVQARLREVEGRLGEMGRQEGSVAPEIGLYRDTDPAASQKLNQLMIERQDLLSRYKPGAQPVRDKDEQIAKLQAMVSQNKPGDGARRFGVNPVYQTVQTEKIQLTAEAASLKQRGEALTGQLGQVDARRQKLTQLEPKFLELAQNRDLLQTNIKALAQKEQQDQASNAIARKTNDNIRIVERPVAPTKGKSLKRPLLVLAFMFAGFTALCAGLLRVFLRRGFSTPTSAARTLELPVLATAGYKPQR
jgi:uncharacterized protein involved in exopolysaccharide biosynthesis